MKRYAFITLLALATPAIANEMPPVPTPPPSLLPVIDMTQVLHDRQGRPLIDNVAPVTSEESKPPELTLGRVVGMAMCADNGSPTDRAEPARDKFVRCHDADFLEHNKTATLTPKQLKIIEDHISWTGVTTVVITAVFEAIDPDAGKPAEHEKK